MANRWKIYTDSATTGWDNMPWTTPTSTGEDNEIEIIKKSIDKKKIREEIKYFMEYELKKAAEKEAGKLFKDVEKLKEEKKRLGIAISSLKQELKKAKREIREEIEAMENMLKKYAHDILRFQNMDI